MVILAKKFTPEVLITAPRRSPASPNDDGSYALYSVSKYSLESHSETKEIRVLSLESGRTTLFTDDSRFKEARWLKDNWVVLLKDVEGGETEVWIGKAGEDEKSEYLAGIIPGPIFNFTTKELPNGSFAVVFNAKATVDEEELFNPEKAPKPLSSAREYTTPLSRYWDTYYTAERYTVWYTTLNKTLRSDQYKLSDSPIINALQGTGLTSPPFPPSLLDGKNLDVSTNGILFTSLNPAVDIAKDFVFSLYYIPIDDFTKAATPPRNVVPGTKRSISYAVFSPNGKAAAFLATPPNDYSNTSIYVIGELDNQTSVREVKVFDTKSTGEIWALKARSIAWSNDATELYVTAEDRGRGRLFKIQGPPAEPSEPIALTDGGGVSSFHPLTRSASEKRLFVNKTSLVDNGIFTVVNTSAGTTSLISSASKNGQTLGLSTSQVSSINFKSRDGDYDIQAWVVKPSTFSPSKRYPLALLIHGGPVGSWTNSWSTRWNPAVFAEQGYIVVAPNPTGSTGFGQAFVDAIVGDWGGRPYHDIVACYEHIAKTMKFVDTTRAVALGASYGGYMMNWIAGQPLAKKLKAIVCHDGIFSLYSMLGSDDGSLLNHDMGVQLWDDPSAWDRNDPAQHTDRWDTPMLIIHSDRDYRCPITQGLASYNVCQARGIDARFLNFPDENHFVLQRENSLVWHRTVLGWINHYAGVRGGVVLEPPVSEPQRKAQGEEGKKGRRGA